ncbi:TolC family protein [Luteimonas sp. FCS-9]|uniref:TolC family protein n=1 Tax=Luteimonas sp. FCS-9 TaxID=1547516 RepID=UPI00063EA070|nr:TolC family protein [Luteimonas sp. FCS-9]KLI98992.1 cation transporter [Luteimonas sp. FCS-9]
MLLRLAACAALAAAPCVSPAQAAPPGALDASVPSAPSTARPLTLDDAFARVAQAHPTLRLVDGRRPVLDAERDAATLRPPLEAGLEIENLVPDAPGRRLEATLSLAGVFERGGKPDARRALAQTRIDALALEREAARVDLLAETARRYLDAVLAAQRRRLADDEVAEQIRVVAAARRRFEAGAAPEAAALAAQATQAQAELRRARAQAEGAAARRSLAMLWGASDADVAVADADPLALPPIAAFAELRALLERTPELRRFGDRRRVAEARLQLARSARTPDVGWRLGVRRDQDSGDVSLLGGVTVPLGSRGRAQPEIRAAEAELALLSIEREAGDLALQATLAEAHDRYLVERAEVQRLQDDVLPRFARAAAQTERAWRAGATPYLEWAQLLEARREALRQQLEAAERAQRALIELQRLTGEPLALPATTRGPAR